MNKMKKGQGALEYLLLIGGAVLIAVIVIALLVGMGGQSRDTASSQADKANKALDVPQPAQVISVTAPFNNCDPVSLAADFNFSWRPLGEGGSYALQIKDTSNNIIEGSALIVTASDGTLINSANLNPNITSGLNVSLTLVAGDKCGDTHSIYIVNIKNNQSVTSNGYSFTWHGN